jgi:hypothetical protein
VFSSTYSPNVAFQVSLVVEHDELDFPLSQRSSVWTRRDESPVKMLPWRKNWSNSPGSANWRFGAKPGLRAGIVCMLGSSHSQDGTFVLDRNKVAPDAPCHLGKYYCVGNSFSD